MSDPIIRTRNLSRVFERRQRSSGLLAMVKTLSSPTQKIPAVDGVSITVNTGEMVGLIGQNGAGKSTTIKMLTGILVPSSGDVSVLGLAPAQQRKHLARQIGVVFGQRTQLWWDLPLRDSLDLLRHMYRVPEARFRENQTTAREVLGLDAFLDTPVRQLSLGQRMRGDLAAAMLHDPPLLVLDEPTIGLDLLAKDRIRAFLRHLNETQRTTMLLTTHDLGDIEHLCDRVIVIDHGRVRFDGTADALGATANQEIEIVATFSREPRPFSPLPESITLESLGEFRYLARFSRNAWSTGSALRWLTTVGELEDVNVKPQTLEQVIREMYSGTTTPSPARLVN